MSVVTVSRAIPAPAKRVWEVIADFGAIHRFHPYVERSPIVEGTRSTGLGAERVCHFYDGNRVHERVVELEEGKLLSIEVLGGTMPLAEAVARIEITPRDDAATDVSFTMDYTPKMGLLGKAMDALMMRRKFNQMLSELLAALEEHVVMGRIIQKGFVPSKAVA